jgi:hypothetical protein
MDPGAVREQAIEATTRILYDRHNGVVPSEDSDEWEAEYRRQFEIAKQTQTQAAAPAAASVAAADPALPELTGQPTQLRWAAQLRGDRLKEIRDPDIRRWLATTWLKAKGWIDTSTLPAPVFLQRIDPHYKQWRRQEAERAKAAAAERQAKQAAADELRRQVEAAHITVEGLVEMVDAAERLPAEPIKGKLAELDHDGRNLRIFETADELVLMVLEKNADGRSEYGIERDDGLVADLRLYMRALELL